MTPGRVDVHQHLWTEPLLRALAARSERPRVRRADGRWTLQLDGEPDHAIDLAANDPDARARLLDDDRLDLAVIAPSSPVGVESLPPGEAEPLIEAYGEGVAELRGPFRAWGAVGVVAPDPAAVDAQLDSGMVGITLPASALAGPQAIEHCAPLMARLERRDAPLFVHPGPTAGTEAVAPTDWWSAMTRYVAEMNAAWHAYVGFGANRFPSLRVVFAMLAGLAPLHLERLRARGGPADRAIDRNLFYDTSSYGPRAIDAMVRAVGIDQLVYGSDRPLVEPRDCPLGDAGRHATLVSNPARLLGLKKAA